MISTVIIAKNEEAKIGDCLASLSWAGEVVLVDSGSTDRTIEIAKAAGAAVVSVERGGFSDWRNAGLKASRGDWVLYLDADERVTPLLKNEIELTQKAEQDVAAYAIPRRNIILGKEMKHGGWWPDYVKRLFKKKYLKRWTGSLHEEPEYSGTLGYLKNPMVHLKHDNLAEMVEKTNKWSEIEARLLFEAHHPQMAWWRFVRIILTEIWYRLIVMRGFMDGSVGVIYSFYQSWSRFLTYAKLWEMQLKEGQ